MYLQKIRRAIHNNIIYRKVISNHIIKIAWNCSQIKRQSLAQLEIEARLLNWILHEA